MYIFVNMYTYSAICVSESYVLNKELKAVIKQDTYI